MDLEAGQAMERNDEAREAFPDIFGIPVILNRILEHLPNRQLLKLSVVNKLWKKEARIVMKKRGNVMALLNSDGNRGFGQVFQAFAANLETLNETLYSGMTISLITTDDFEGTGALELERIHESILAGMRGKLKRLVIRLHSAPTVCWIARDYSNNFVQLQFLLGDLVWDLEHLTLETHNDLEPFIQLFLPDGLYPQLKVLKLKSASDKETFGNQIRMLLSRAPNLQELHTDGRVSLLENLMEGREGIVHVHGNYVSVEDILENIIPALRLKNMFFLYTMELKLDRFNEKAQSLLRTCCATTLEWIRLDRVSAVLFMSYGIRLENVEALEFELDYAELEQFEPRLISILSRFDFTYLFPNLKQVFISWPSWISDLGLLSRDTMDAIIEQANAVPMMEPTLPGAGSVKELYFLQENSFPTSTSAVQFFAHMFPAIKELEIMGREEDIPVGSAWELWPDLEWMPINRKGYRRP